MQHLVLSGCAKEATSVGVIYIYNKNKLPIRILANREFVFIIVVIYLPRADNFA